MTRSIEIFGAAPPAIADAFLANFQNAEELGARFSLIEAGVVVADLWAGSASREERDPWTGETLACVYSSGKAAIARLVAQAVSDGKLDYDKPVAEYWPDFAANGKQEISVAMALSHQAGLCGFAEEIPADAWVKHNEIATRLAAMAPLWTPGSAAGYHPQTIGYIANELMRRATGRTIGEILREDYFAADGVDLHCGLREFAVARAATMQKPPRPPTHRDSELARIAFLKPWSSPGKVSREAWMAAEIPASNMHGTALALADFVHPLANRGVDTQGRRVIDEAAIAEALTVRISGEDLVLPFHLTWTAGMMVNTNGHFGPSPTAFGHPGFGGSAVMIDPARRISAAYVMNKMSPALSGDPRAVRLFSAVYD
jgi:CubicO group peptidase (beta-lactamase class C family)